MSGVREWAAEFNEDALYADGFDEAIIGVASRINLGPLVCYDRHKCIEILRQKEGWDYDEAEEFFEYNTAGVGEGTPLFLVAWADAKESWED